MNKENLSEPINDVLADQYLNHKNEFNDWMNRFMGKRPLQQVAAEEERN